MHEASIALSIMERAIEISLENNAKKIISITIVIGGLSGIDKESLLFSFDAIKSDSIAARANLKIIEVPIKINCYDCKKNIILNNIFLMCPECGSINIDVIEGREMSIKEIEVE